MFYYTRRITRGTARVVTAAVVLPAFLGTRAMVGAVHTPKVHSAASDTYKGQPCQDCISEQNAIAREMDALTEQINSTQDRIASDPAYAAALQAHVTELLTLADAYRR